MGPHVEFLEVAGFIIEKPKLNAVADLNLKKEVGIEGHDMNEGEVGNDSKRNQPEEDYCSLSNGLEVSKDHVLKAADFLVGEVDGTSDTDCNKKELNEKFRHEKPAEIL